ncbi:hypothetical protein KA005_32585 [bacterium]|nr:hypothetical protein [bacterium]
MSKFNICFVLFIIIPLVIYPQSPDLKFEHLAMDDGLSSNSVSCIFQDSKGFMWFGTRNGLNRYDGNTLKIYQHDPEDPNSISDNRIAALYEDSDNKWIGTYGGGLAKSVGSQWTVYDPSNSGLRDYWIN